MADTPPGKASFAHLPVGRSISVQMLLLIGGALTGACVFWIRSLRFDFSTHDLAPIFITLFENDDYGAAMLALGILVVALFVPRQERLHRMLRWVGEHPYRVAGVVSVLLAA